MNCSRWFRTAAIRLSPSWFNATPSAFTASPFAICKIRRPPKTSSRTRFSKLWEDPEKWQADKNSKFTTWFYRVVVNLCLDWQKRKRPVALNEDMPLIDDRESVDQAMLRREEQRILEQEIAALPERQRTAINLWFDEGLSNQDAADVMGVNLKALQSLIMRAKTTLKERMKNYL